MIESLSDQRSGLSVLEEALADDSMWLIVLEQAWGSKGRCSRLAEHLGPKARTREHRGGGRHPDR